MKRGPSKGYDTSDSDQDDESNDSDSYIKELADRLNSLESQIQQPQMPTTNYDFGPIDQSLEAPSHFSRKRTHSLSENFGDPYNRPNWSSNDRGIYNAADPAGLYPLTREEHPLNGAGASNRRVSFTEWTLAGNLITGSNEATIKAYVFFSPPHYAIIL